ncbi:MAG: pyridoxal 5'-phosphate synthase glutaminase subunit PdxT [Prevotellaceae bacterium]|nr:pyridoxal 5'-phosphate synthase glutaminase subunit PdxT [Prevotellaceae bacterium]MDO4931319.1 pyridoxal 5'-phosphate synthase glutaminase subunit PdxT [Prevotellaceae bacterium]
MKRIAILALQGAFAEHEDMLQHLGAETMQIRNLVDWEDFLGEKGMDGDYTGLGLVIPGGESTAMMRIMRDEDLFEPLQEAIRGGLPVFGTCAGLILLDKVHLDTMNITALRNAYGRQLGSFFVEAPVDDIGTVPMTFIRAPYISEAGEGVTVLAKVDGRIIAAQQDKQLVTAFHPELNEDTRVHAYFLSMVS